MNYKKALSTIITLVATACVLVVVLLIVVLNKESFDKYFAEQNSKNNNENVAAKGSSIKEEKTTDWSAYTDFFEPLETQALSEENELTEAKVLLGKHLYFDTRLSKDGNNSCNSCHNLDTYGVDNLSFSPGDLGENGGRNSPTTLNSAFHFLQFWDGRAKDVEEQAGGPILNPVEMNIPSKEFLVDRLNGIEGYVNQFEKAFPEADTAITYWHVQKSIAAFERTLVTPTGFDEFLTGKEDALNEEQLKGLQVFVDAGCIQCHSGVLLGGSTFQKFGVHGNYWEATGSENIDEGRFEVTAEESDKHIFKVPSLRNIAKTAPYFHDGSVAELDEAVKIMAKVQLNKDLSTEEITSIVTFLEALTGELTEEQKSAPEMF